MRYRKLSATGDYTFGQGQGNFFINNADAVAQSCKTRLLLMAGEWFLDTTSGTPYNTQILGAHTRSTRDLAIKSRILETEGVLELLEYSSEVVDRDFRVDARVQTIYGPTPIEVAFP